MVVDRYYFSLLRYLRYKEAFNFFSTRPIMTYLWLGKLGTKRRGFPVDFRKENTTPSSMAMSQEWTVPEHPKGYLER